MSTSLGEAIKAECAKRKITLGDQSIAFGLSANTLSRWCNGVEPQPPSYGLLMKFLGVTLDQLGALIIEEQLRRSGIPRP